MNFKKQVLLIYQEAITRIVLPISLFIQSENQTNKHL